MCALDIHARSLDNNLCLIDVDAERDLRAVVHEIFRIQLRAARTSLRLARDFTQHLAHRHLRITLQQRHNFRITLQ